MNEIRQEFEEKFGTIYKYGTDERLHRTDSGALTNACYIKVNGEVWNFFEPRIQQYADKQLDEFVKFARKEERRAVLSDKDWKPWGIQAEWMVEQFKQERESNG